MVLNLNSVMSIIANVPASIASIVACHVVRHLTSYANQAPENFACVIPRLFSMAEC